MNRKSKIAIATCLAAALGWYLASPWMVLYQMKSAVKQRDAAAVSEHIDFPALRENVKAELTAAMMAEATKHRGENPLSTAGSALALAFAGPMLDAMISPQGVAMMLKGEDEGLVPKAFRDTSSSDVEVTRAYKGLDTFEVKLASGQQADSSITLVFKRHGFANWMLTSAQLLM